MKKLSDYVIEFVAGAGVKHIFMLAGGGSMHLVDSVGRHRELEYVCCLHEQACSFAAEHYAEFTDGLGVALVTTGPGGTNAVTGVAAAWLESASCLFLSGQAKRGDLIGATGVRSMGQQEVDIVAVVKPLTKYAVTVLDPATIRYHLEKAVYLATHGRRGPVWIDIPLDVQAATIDETGLRGFVPPPVARAASLERQVSEAIGLIDDSQRPVLFLGNGSRAALAGGELGQLVDLLKIPVLVTWKMADFLPEANPYYAGRPGAIGQRGANFTEQNADCLIIVGARLDRPQTAFSHRNFARAATKIMVDVDTAELAKIQTEVHVPVCADAGVFTREFLRQSGPPETEGPLLLGEARQGVERTLPGGAARVLGRRRRGKHVRVDGCALGRARRDRRDRSGQLRALQRYLHAGLSREGRATHRQRSGPRRHGNRAAGGYRRVPGQRPSPHRQHQRRRRLPAQRAGTRNRPPAESAHQVLRPRQRRLRLHHGHAAELLRAAGSWAARLRAT